MNQEQIATLQALKTGNLAKKFVINGQGIKSMSSGNVKSTTSEREAISNIAIKDGAKPLASGKTPSYDEQKAQSILQMSDMELQLRMQHMNKQNA